MCEKQTLRNQFMGFIGSRVGYGWMGVDVNESVVDAARRFQAVGYNWI
jgi:hypothetical protein